MNLVERLRLKARGSAETSQMIARSKSERNQAAGDIGANYEGGTPEQMLEWKAADELEALRRIVGDFRIMARTGAFKQHADEPWMLRLMNIDIHS